MEFKWKADLKEEEMEQFAADALRQIDKKRYTYRYRHNHNGKS